MGSVQLEVVFSIPLFHYHQKPHYYTSSEIADETSELLHYSLSNSVGDLSTWEFSKKSDLRPHLSHQVIHLMWNTVYFMTNGAGALNRQFMWNKHIFCGTEHRNKFKRYKLTGGWLQWLHTKFHNSSFDL